MHHCVNVALSSEAPSLTTLFWLAKCAKTAARRILKSHIKTYQAVYANPSAVHLVSLQEANLVTVLRDDI